MAAQLFEYEGKGYKNREFVVNKINNMIKQMDGNKDADGVRFFVGSMPNGRFYPMAVIPGAHFYLHHFLARADFYCIG